MALSHDDLVFVKWVWTIVHNTPVNARPEQLTDLQRWAGSVLDQHMNVATSYDRDWMAAFWCCNITTQPDLPNGWIWTVIAQRSHDAGSYLWDQVASIPHDFWQTTLDITNGKGLWN